ncbi:MAG: Rne/Rng family ribonuclease [Geminicoccaceae bacterium]
MLIDATHPEETRAVVVDDRYLADFDFETSTKLQLKGNVYLAKVTRVEPSLQAAFVEYGGNRHGFLAFSEIHPDYFQVPQADRALLEDIERETATKPGASDAEPESAGDVVAAETITNDADEETAEVMADQARRRARLLRSYKIQEVIKRRQIMLVQVVKEERGNKGAALTTYLSLAGRYCVLMPNTPRGGGISRKIVQPDDRRKLKEIAQDLDVPTGMGLIIRTAGQERSKAEIKRDYEYLLRLWNEIRETTLKSIAPKMIYEEGDLIKRAMRDLYTRDIEEVLVEGEEGYRSAKRLMTMLMPSRARLVKQYKEETPLFFEYKVEDQLDAMHSPTVQLPAGGSIVIHTTEALTAIDVNSGRSTRERHIDETAVKTNLEAADEVARQLRLRDLAGLIVIDFIDMAESRHQRSVEKRLRDALKADRARIQIGKISQFGLLELSRQRLRASLQELSSQICPHCAGLGVVRSTESCALQTLRAVQEHGIRGDAASLRVVLPGEVALYVLNQKREALSRLEQRYAMRVMIHVDQDLVPPSMRIDVTEKRERLLVRVEAAQPIVAEVAEEVPEEIAEVEVHDEPAQPVRAEAAPVAAEDGEEANARRRRKRRRRRRRPSDGASAPEAALAGESGETDEEIDQAEPYQAELEHPTSELELAEAADQPIDVTTPSAEAISPSQSEMLPDVEVADAVAEAPAEVVPEPAEVDELTVAPEPEPTVAPIEVEEPAAAAEPAVVASEPAVEVAEEAPKPAKPKRVRKPRKTKAMIAAEAAAAEAAAAAAEATAETSVSANISTDAQDASALEAMPAFEPEGEPLPQAPMPEEATLAAEAVPPPAAVSNGADREADEPVADDGANAEQVSAATEESAETPQRQGWWSRWVR